MTRRTLPVWMLLLTALRADPAAGAPALTYQAMPELFRPVAEIFRSRCDACHGERRQRNGLRLDRREAALAGGRNGPVIVPGDSGASRLIVRVSSDDSDLRMPPRGAPLTAAEIASLRAWIDAGAIWPSAEESAAAAGAHWAYQPIERPDPPAVEDEDWVRGDLDRFVLHQLEAESVKPSPEADPFTLVRRLSLDLIGLPPTPEEVQQFVTDPAPGAYERLVDRLLASPHYGEKWALHWLDLARYADSEGFEVDQERPFAWRYRQWVIDALNADLPFDQFTIQQLAGDLLPDATVEQRVATGFHRNAPLSREAGTKPEHSRFEHIVDRTNTVGTVWLGMSVACAQCHDHKYDPLTQREYYQLFACFDRSENVDIDAPLPGEEEAFAAIQDELQEKRRELLDAYEVSERRRPWEQQLRRSAEHPGRDEVWDMHRERLAVYLDRGVDILLTDNKDRTRQERLALLHFFLNEYGQVVSKEEWLEWRLPELSLRLDQLRDEYPNISSAHVVREDPRRTETVLYHRGDFFQPGEAVTPGTPAFLPAPAEPVGDRLALARWIVALDNPLTARVIVNRQFQELFGRGIVGSSADFGTRGEKPTHPELLDALAHDFQRGGWHLKALHRAMVLSATYRQSSDRRIDLDELDPENHLWARQTRFRLPAELIRDSALAVSGLLHPTIGGPSIRPPQPAGYGALSESGDRPWVETPGEGRHRRGLYIHFQRTAPYPQLTTFDAPTTNVACSRRTISNTPLQALDLLNDPVFFEAATALAGRLLSLPPGDPERIDHAFRRCLGRPPNPREAARLEEFVRAQREAFREQPDVAAQLARRAPGSPAGPDETATWIATARLLLNLDEFLTRE